MAIGRRSMVGLLGAGVLGPTVLGACVPRRGSRPTEPPVTGADLALPEGPLVIGSIGAEVGRSAGAEHAVALAIHEAVTDVNARWGGAFGADLEVVERHVVTEVGEDLSGVIADLAAAGATAVVSSLDEEALLAAMPAFVEAGIAVIDVFTTGMGLRADDAPDAGMLARLIPDDRLVATHYAEEALSGGSGRGGDPGTLAYVGEDHAQGRSLLEELTRVLNPAGGRVVAEHVFAPGSFGDLDAVVASVLETPPALLVVNGAAADVGPFLAALHTATLDDSGRPGIDVPRRLAPPATVDYAEAGMGAESLTAATGLEPGGELTDAHVNMMLNADENLLRTGYAYSQQAYDAVVLAVLAAHHALSVQGTEIAAALPAVLTGQEQCTDYEMCRQLFTDALEAGSRATVQYVGRTGPLALGSNRDPAEADVRLYTWTEANELEAGTVEGLSAEG